MTNTPRILVLGDVHIDCLLATTPPHLRGNPDSPFRDAHFLDLTRLGGAWLLQDIIIGALSVGDYQSHPDTRAPLNPAEVTCFTRPLDLNAIRDSLFQFITLLDSFPHTTADDKNRVYRVARSVGWVNTSPEAAAKRCSTTLTDLLTALPSKTADARYDFLVIHDTNGTFRRQDKKLLKQVIAAHLAKDTGWLVWHMYSPLTKGQLWEAVSEGGWLDRTIIVVNLECLREAGMDLPQITSLEHEAYLFSSGMRKTDLKTLTKAALVIAHAHREGALLFYQDEGLMSSCYYCPYLVGDALSDWGGVMVGYSSLLVAAILRGMVHNSRLSQEKLLQAVVPAVKQAIVLDHIHYLNGFGRGTDVSTHLQPTSSRAFYHDLFETLATLNNASWELGGRKYFVTALPLPKHRDLKKWNRITGFIQARFDRDNPIRKGSGSRITKVPREYALGLARRIVLGGLREVVENAEQAADDTLPHTPRNRVDCPYHQYGAMITAYRNEIDGLSNIERIMRKYLADERWTKPLPIAVFGPPGSGKSFAVSEILKTIAPDIAKRPLTFNLSQMTIHSNDLAIAFHKVQDEAVMGNVPLVFFDEFDAEGGGWLRFFLAPMQDGQFKAGESTYGIGRSMFVFAGGVSKKWKEFRAATKSDRLYAKQKGPDFVSRLRGHLDIESINPTGKGVPDHTLLFRRAVLLRSLLEKHHPGIIDEVSKRAWIDEEVVDYLLEVPRYEHEVRSFEAIIQMSQISPRGKIHMASLPTEQQRKMHMRL